MKRRDRGFAILIVLWTLAGLSLLAARIVSLGGGEARLAANLRAEAAVREAADGAVYEAVFRLVAGQWGAGDPVRHSFPVGTARVTLTIEDEDGKINPNFSPPRLVAALLRNVGVPDSRASGLASAMMDWRTRSLTPSPGGAKLPQYVAAGREYGPSGTQFGSTGEIGLVLGMTPDVLARIEPFISVYGESDPARALGAPLAEAVVEASISGPASGQPAFQSKNVVARVEALATIQGGATFARRAVVRIRRSPAPGEPMFQILTWTVPGGG